MSDGTIEQVCVIGAGTMGHGIAQVIASTSTAVCLHDVSQDAIDAGLAKVRANLDKGVARGKVSVEQQAVTLAHLRGSASLQDAVAGVDLVIEAVPERVPLKRLIFEAVAQHVAPTTIFATNTSSIPLASLVDVLPDPGKFVGMHFFNPVHIQPLLEVVNAEGTDEVADGLRVILFDESATHQGTGQVAGVDEASENRATDVATVRREVTGEGEVVDLDLVA